MESIIIAAIITGIAGIAAASIGLLKRRRPPDRSDEKPERTTGISNTHNRVDWTSYKDLFRVDDYQLAYIPIINDWRSADSPRDLPWTSIAISRDSTPFRLDRLFDETVIRFDYRSNDPSCRLSTCTIAGGQSPRLSVCLQQTFYEDYLRSGEHLDDPFPDDPRKTFREALGSIVEVGTGQVKPAKLTNICGVGIFLVTKDRSVIVARHSDESPVYPGRLSFSASGVMKWGYHPHPFMEMARKTFQEIQFQVNPAKTRLLGFGADARKLYFQFSFLEYVDLEEHEIRKRHSQELDTTNEGLLRDRPRELISLPLEVAAIRDSIVDHCWEPAAEACLLTLAAKEFGIETVAEALHERKGDWVKREMRDEWDYRASRKGDLPDMSVRYPPDKLSEGKKRYVEAVLEFIKNDIKGKDVVEIGAGTGRITEQLVRTASRVTCIDLCRRMIERNQETLGSDAAEVTYHHLFGQDYDHRPKHDVAICSLVLIHNVAEDQFRRLTESICNCANTVFVFEDVSLNRRTSHATRLRTENDLVEAFGKNSFFLKGRREKLYELFGDQIAFLKFVERARPKAAHGDVEYERLGSSATE